jgi:hypothetical protein
MESVMFSDRYKILELLNMLLEFHKKSEIKDSNAILSDVQNIVEIIHADIDNEAFDYENYQDAMVVANG